MFPKWVRLILILQLTLHPFIGAEFLCYRCWGDSETKGQFCSNGNLCYGATCYFNVQDNGQWDAGCLPEKGSATTAEQMCSYANSNTSCECVGDFCNKLTVVIQYLKGYWPEAAPGKTIVPFLPSDEAIPCFECGRIKLNDTVTEIPCDKDHLCNGGYCMTVKGEYPYSYCASSWEGDGTVKCEKLPGERERCVCAGQMCNFPYDPDQIPTTTTTTTPAGPAATTAKAPVPSKKNCTEARFNPNQQAVFMGNKLKEIIMNGFGKSNPAVQNFEAGIDEHICGYDE